MLNNIYQALDPIAFTIGPFAVRWYGLAYALGFMFGALLLYSIVKRWKLKMEIEDLLTMVLCLVLGLVIGARLGYCLFYGNGYYFAHPSEFFAVWNGGMSFHGGAVGLCIALCIYAKVKKFSALTLLDLVTIVAPIGLFLGRCANFINGELWGKVTDLPWGVIFDGQTLPRHPTQLYEALLEGVLIFVVLFVLSRKNPPRVKGTFLGIFMVMYGISRFAIEFVRLPDAQIGYLIGDWFTMGQLLSIPLIIGGICVLVYAKKHKRPQAISLADERECKSSQAENCAKE